MKNKGRCPKCGQTPKGLMIRWNPKICDEKNRNPFYCVNCGHEWLE